MQVVIRFAKRDKSDVEVVREVTVPIKTFGQQHFNWHEAVAAAIFHSQEGERIVMVAEGGYH